ncbi:hypothetical protein DL89DRAFT_264329 [Linderina pennispora]|uniref:Uncharacterized protein n=1 Tax=Linderina pennispora TaxID=61395 RepID=A0A1Y1WLM5_9FUNG|nr:uncharacterized protein DL89DRAFT_264329 [Linderina pennispora]ORX74470.1 hypothetical protein DL89DRAFT_264329 [Linderina pennispora]
MFLYSMLCRLLLYALLLWRCCCMLCSAVQTLYIPLKGASEVVPVVISSTTTVYGVTTVTVYPDNPASVPPESTQYKATPPGTAVVIYSVSTVFLTTIYQTSYSTYHTTLYNSPSTGSGDGHYITSTNSVGFPVVIVTTNDGVLSAKRNVGVYSAAYACAALVVSSLAILLS